MTVKDSGTFQFIDTMDFSHIVKQAIGYLWYGLGFFLPYIITRWSVMKSANKLPVGFLQHLVFYVAGILFSAVLVIPILLGSEEDGNPSSKEWARAFSWLIVISIAVCLGIYSGFKTLKSKRL